MPPLSDMQAGFAGALLDVGRVLPAGLKSPRRAAPRRRFDVYRNNVHAGLIAVLRDRFPAVARLVGAEFFAAMAREFIMRHPPRSPALIRYGGQFAAFIDRFAPVSALPYLGDVARLEWARAQACHAADAEPLDPAALRGIAPERAERLRLTLHPSVRVVRSGWPVVSIWSANAGDAEPGPVDLGAGGEDALVLRPYLEVLVRRLPQGGADFVAALAEGGTLGEAAGAGVASSGGFDLQANLIALMRCGAVTGLPPGGEKACEPRMEEGRVR